MDQALADKMDNAYRYGADELDAYDPYWRERVYLSVLDMSERHYCVLGQLFDGDLDKAMEEIGIASLGSYGFDLPMSVVLEYPTHVADEAYEYLNMLWRAEVGISEEDY
jgi:hypothetical protein